jgi:hypothetical protein
MTTPIPDLRTPDAERPCPFCPGKVMLWRGNPDAIGHSMPPCAEFLKTEPDEFLGGAAIAKVRN